MIKLGFKLIRTRSLPVALVAIGALAMTASGVQAAPDGTLGVALLGAHVGSTGTLIAGAGATGASQLAGFTGDYEVDFNRDVSNCFYNAVSFTGTVALRVEPRSGNANGVFVVFSTLGTTSTSPVSTNSEFYMTVYCGR